MRTTQSMGALMTTRFFPFAFPANAANNSFAASSDDCTVSISITTLPMRSAASDLDRRLSVSGVLAFLRKGPPAVDPSLSEESWSSIMMALHFEDEAVPEALVRRVLVFVSSTAGAVAVLAFWAERDDEHKDREEGSETEDLLVACRTEMDSEYTYIQA